MSRRKGRILAFQALYSYDVGGVPLDELLTLEWEYSGDDETVEHDQTTDDFARILISGTINHLEEIDALIQRHLTGNWEFGRINKVSLAILRMSVFSLLYQKDMPPSVVIDEAIAITKKYGADDAFRFINAVLDSIHKELDGK